MQGEREGKSGEGGWEGEREMRGIRNEKEIERERRCESKAGERIGSFSINGTIEHTCRVQGALPLVLQCYFHN